LKSRTDIFQPTLRNSFYKRWPIIFFYGRGCFFVRCCRKNFNVRRLGFFVGAQPKLWFGRHRHVFVCLARKPLTNLAKKHELPILIKKNSSRLRAGKFTDRGLKKNHRVKPIEHFLIDIIHILFRDWIENTTADIGRCKAATDIFLSTLCNFFYKRWPIIFFYGRGCFFVRCCRKNLQCRSARFFQSSSTKLVFRRTPACYHLFGKENISQPRQKNMINWYW